MKDQKLFMGIVAFLFLAAGFTGCKKVEVPQVETIPPVNVLTGSAELGGKITDDGGGVISASGICWSTSAGADISDNIAKDGSTSGQYSILISGLTASTTYYYRAFATNEAGTSYGKEYTVVTSYGTVTDFEGNVYNTVKIGSQVWMRENLRSTKYSDGTSIAGIQTPPGIIEKTGYSYTFSAAMKGSSQTFLVPSGVQGACPTGWHIPSEGEFNNLESFLGMPGNQIVLTGIRGTTEANLLKTADQSLWGANDKGVNISGFTALPVAVWNGQGFETEYYFAGVSAHFWTASQTAHALISNVGGIHLWLSFKVSNAISIRCLKD
jgi:uncharacterized protein (TIGR02145 family)